MFEVIKIILRVISGVIPILWGFSYWMFLKKNKFEKMCGALSLSLITIGIAECLSTVIGF